jgi:hypothetical protein
LISTKLSKKKIQEGTILKGITFLRLVWLRIGTGGELL